nr:MAG TPA: hypothetical protein [Caudoviricetes sp.]
MTSTASIGITHQVGILPGGSFFIALPANKNALRKARRE